MLEWLLSRREGVDFIHVAHLRVVVNAVMELRLYEMRRISWLAEQLSACHERCFMEYGVYYCLQWDVIFMGLLLLLLLLIIYDMDVSCHRPFLSGTSLEPAVIPTVQASSFTLQYFPYYVWCSKYSRLLYWIYRMFSWYSFQIFP